MQCKSYKMEEDNLTRDLQLKFNKIGGQTILLTVQILFRKEARSMF
uniref:Uncharacterized protein n=1 Tax=Wuchereria bancrofti TaxID=6293 RepID=A0AAF5PGC0_WUCBA